MQNLNFYSPLITASATIFIAFSSIMTLVFIIWSNYKKNQEDKTFRDEVKSLYQAIVIATLMNTNHPYIDLDNNIKYFNGHYKGKVKIFD